MPKILNLSFFCQHKTRKLIQKLFLNGKSYVEIFFDSINELILRFFRPKNRNREKKVLKINDQFKTNTDSLRMALNTPKIPFFIFKKLKIPNPIV